MKEIQSVLQLAGHKFHQVFHTLLLSFEGTVDAITASLDPLYLLKAAVKILLQRGFSTL